jgi:hypothetical protein
MLRASLPLLLVWLAPVLRAQEAAVPEGAVRAEFRIFDGTEEITAATRLRIMPTGRRDAPTTVRESRELAAMLSPGIYDVQALRLRQDAIVAIRWAERLVVMHYPDEGGRHLEVINFTPGFGALQVRAARGPLSAYEVEVFAAGSRGDPAATPVNGGDYKLFVLPAGRYDIRVRHAGAPETSQEAHWILDIEVPADRTRLKQIDVP